MKNKYTRINPLMVIATEDVELVKPYWEACFKSKNSRAMLSKKLKELEKQPKTKLVKKGDIAWLMYSWNSTQKGLSKMYFFDTEPASWTWLEEAAELSSVFKSMEQIVTEI